MAKMDETWTESSAVHKLGMVMNTVTLVLGMERQGDQKFKGKLSDVRS